VFTLEMGIMKLVYLKKNLELFLEYLRYFQTSIDLKPIMIYKNGFGHSAAPVIELTIIASLKGKHNLLTYISVKACRIQTPGSPLDDQQVCWKRKLSHIC
jgi:hypothetical protein